MTCPLLRVGRKVGRTIYMQVGVEPSDDDPLVGVMDTPELAVCVVSSLARERERVEREEAEPRELHAGLRAAQLELSFEVWTDLNARAEAVIASLESSREREQIAEAALRVIANGQWARPEQGRFTVGVAGARQCAQAALLRLGKKEST